MNTRSHAAPDHSLAAEPWPETLQLYRSEGFAEDLAPPVDVVAPLAPRRSDRGMGMVRRIERLTGTVLAASMRPARAILA